MPINFGEIISGTVVPPPFDAFTPLNYTPTARQAAFHKASEDRIDAILYGGAAGGGKSCAFLMDAIKFATNYAGMRIGCFRRSYPELEESFLAELAKRDYAKAVGGRYRATSHTLSFPNGSVINFSYAESVQDASRILGGEYQAFYIDEAGLMLPEVIAHIEERLRSGNKLVPVIGIRFATNPGGVGHKYMKDRFITPTKRGRKVAKERVGDSDFTRSVAFIPAKVSDNPHVNEGYTAVLDSIPDPQRRAAMRDGDWDAMVGQFFMQWSYSRHVIPIEDSFTIPMEWQRYAGIDYGTQAPFAVIWGAQDNDGRLWLYREKYARGLYATDQAHVILDMEKEGHDPWVMRYADPSMWGTQSTPLTIADQYALEGCGIEQADNNRPNGWARCHTFLNEGLACPYHQARNWKTCPMLHVFESACPMFIDTIPSLPRDPNKPDDAATKNVDDHLADALRYMCMAVGTSARPVFYEDVKPTNDLPEAPKPASAPEPPKDEGTQVPMMGGFVIADSGLSPY